MYQIKNMGIKKEFILNKIKNSSLFKDSFWALLGSVLGKGLSLLSGILVARFLGKETYGEYGLIKNTLLYIAVFSTLGLGYSGTRYIAKCYQENRGEVKALIRTIYKITFVASFFMAAMLFLFANQVAIFIKAPDVTDSLKLTSFVIIANAINTSQIGILSGLKKFKEIAKNNTFSGIVTFVTSALFTYYWNFNGALFSLLISMTFNAIINYLSIQRELLKIEVVSTKLIYGSRELISFSIPIALQESMYSIVTWGGSYLIIIYGGYGELGILSAAAQWSSMVLFIPGVLKNVMLSYFSSTASTHSLQKKMIAINFVATATPCLVIIILSQFIAGFYGDTFTNLNVVLSIGCITSIFSSISSVIIYEFISLGRNWTVFFARFIRDIFSLGIIWFCISYISTIQASIISNLVHILVEFVFMIGLLVAIRLYSSNNEKCNIN